MIVGTTIFRLDGSAYYSPEIPRGGLAATFVVDVSHLALTGAGKLAITVEHRNADETTWSTAATFTETDTVAVISKDATAIEEIIRFKLVFTNTTTATDAAHFLIQAPSWRPYT